MAKKAGDKITKGDVFFVQKEKKRKLFIIHIFSRNMKGDNKSYGEDGR